ncbi:DUF3868 domain-containing protein [uncultured Parabacteroides sp.]|uniref:DUF3868 domain-containing protein n=1 Tax=uncultured Parabacteroides sp. TaxID=512312 RepID=UPI00258E4611|nr:DUF3868 domain-containing protein [uncultured Parabacteroides sp.]
MKHLLVYILTLLLLLPDKAGGQEFRIIPQEISVHNDSLHLILSMDLNNIKTGSLTALTFTPVLADKTHRLPLPPVVVSGAKRYRYDQREQTLSGKDAPAPYRILRGNKPKPVDYTVSIPYASWMAHASLLLQQEIKDCCDLRLLGTDTLTGNLALSNIPSPDIPAPSAAPHQTRKPGRTTVALSGEMLASCIPMVSFLTPLPEKDGKQRSGKATLYIDYPLGKFEILPDFKNNRKELGKMDSLLTPVLESGYTKIEQIDICGYASPDGPYKHNEELSSNRSQYFTHYIRSTYRLPQKLFNVSSVAEDWDGLVVLLEQVDPPYKQEVLQTIRQNGIFEGREKQLMELPDNVYKKLCRDLFPLLRRLEVAVDYHVARVETKDAATLIYSHPELLSLEEMYEVARYYRPGTVQYREVYEIAAFHFPQDVVANVNAASAVMLGGDLKSAWNYLSKVEDDPRAWNNMGVLTLLEGDSEGAAVWFRKAIGVEPLKARANLQKIENGESDTGHE